MECLGRSIKSLKSSIMIRFLLVSIIVTSINTLDVRISPVYRHPHDPPSSDHASCTQEYQKVAKFQCILMHSFFAQANYVTSITLLVTTWFLANIPAAALFLKADLHSVDPSAKKWHMR